MTTRQVSKLRAVEPSLYIGQIPRYACGNGLSATMWVSLEDVHASSVTSLLDALAEVGIPAYVQAIEPLGNHNVGGHRSHHQLLRLWVEAHETLRAEQLLSVRKGRAFGRGE